jgi:hypothetical protein
MAPRDRFCLLWDLFLQLARTLGTRFGSAGTRFESVGTRFEPVGTRFKGKAGSRSILAARAAGGSILHSDGKLSNAQLLILQPSSGPDVSSVSSRSDTGADLPAGERVGSDAVMLVLLFILPPPRPAGPITKTVESTKPLSLVVSSTIARYRIQITVSIRLR